MSVGVLIPNPGGLTPESRGGSDPNPGGILTQNPAGSDPKIPFSSQTVPMWACSYSHLSPGGRKSDPKRRVLTPSPGPVTPKPAAFPPLFSLGCQRSIGLSNGKAKVCGYSGWYYCSSCHVDDNFLIPARLVHNWDTSKYKVIFLQVGLLASELNCW